MNCQASLYRLTYSVQQLYLEYIEPGRLVRVFLERIFSHFVLRCAVLGLLLEVQGIGWVLLAVGNSNVSRPTHSRCGCP